MATRLGIYNAALAEIGARELVSDRDPVESRRVLDRLWDAGFVKRCLEQGEWNFAMRSVKSTDDPPPPAFGYSFRHAKPSDWVRTRKISADPTFSQLLDAYSDEGVYWYADYDILYIQFVSSHPSYGANLAGWPESFSRYAALYLACLAAPRLLVPSEAQAALKGQQGLTARCEMDLRNAKAKDSSNQPPEFPPTGSWVRSRSGFNDPSNNSR